MNAVKDIFPLQMYKGITKRQLNDILLGVMFEKPICFRKNKEIFKAAGCLINNTIKEEQQQRPILLHGSSKYARNSNFNRDILAKKFHTINSVSVSDPSISLEIELKPEEIRDDVGSGIPSNIETIGKYKDRVNYDSCDSSNGKINSVIETSYSANENSINQNDKDNIYCKIEISKECDDDTQIEELETRKNICLKIRDNANVKTIREKLKKTIDNDSNIVFKVDDSFDHIYRTINSSDVTYKYGNKYKIKSTNRLIHDTKSSKNNTSAAEPESKINFVKEKNPVSENCSVQYKKTDKEEQKIFPSVNSDENIIKRLFNHDNMKFFFELASKKEVKESESSVIKNRKCVTPRVNKNTFHNRKDNKKMCDRINSVINRNKKKRMSSTCGTSTSLELRSKISEEKANGKSIYSDIKSEFNKKTFLNNPKEFFNSDNLRLNFLLKEKVEKEEQKTSPISILELIKTSKEAFENSPMNPNRKVVISGLRAKYTHPER
ncbi:uncharacterized protein LOC142317756 [Lycorma delicatula]|uniref:uncharacterized protein LOC142317756 n=1 Tax=Lycorma delicatula TaxID=130591 RepID=UPI003F519CCA